MKVQTGGSLAKKRSPASAGHKGATAHADTSVFPQASSYTTIFTQPFNLVQSHPAVTDRFAIRAVAVYADNGEVNRDFQTVGFLRLRVGQAVAQKTDGLVGVRGHRLHTDPGSAAVHAVFSGTPRATRRV